MNDENINLGLIMYSTDTKLIWACLKKLYISKEP